MWFTAVNNTVMFLLWFCREFGPVFSWMMGPTKMTTVVDYEAIRSLLQLGDSKVSC
jgi:hypothetical protein